MTKQEQINKILQAIREANPELLELSVGCEVRLKYDEDFDIYTIIGGIEICNKHKLFKNCDEDCYDGGFTEEGYLCSYGDEETGFGTLKVKDENIYEIIGKEPHLEHLFHTIGIHRNLIEQKIQLISKGSIAYLDLCDKYWNCIKQIEYDLTKSVEENLENQELRELLLEILN